MKQIELTTEQQSNLLEMIKVLFPEYKSTVFISFNGDMMWSKSSSLESHNSKIHGEVIHIHWLELCLVYLMPKLFKEIMVKEKYWKENEYISWFTRFLSPRFNGVHELIDCLYYDFIGED